MTTSTPSTIPVTSSSTSTSTSPPAPRPKPSASSCRPWSGQLSRTHRLWSGHPERASSHPPTHRGLHSQKPSTPPSGEPQPSPATSTSGLTARVTSPHVGVAKTQLTSARVTPRGAATVASGTSTSAGWAVEELQSMGDGDASRLTVKDHVTGVRSTGPKRRTAGHVPVAAWSATRSSRPRSPLAPGRPGRSRPVRLRRWPTTREPPWSGSTGC